MLDRKIKWLVFILVLILGLFMGINASASNSNNNHVIDEADLLTEAEEADLKTKIDDIINSYGFDVVILTVNSLDGKTPEAYADDYYDYNNYNAYGGALFLISMEERDYYTSTEGWGIDVFTDYGIGRLNKIVKSYLSDGDYYGGCKEFLCITEDYIKAYNEGTPYGTNNPYKESKNYFLREIAALIAAFIISLVSVLAMKHKMNTARPQEYAGNYQKKNSFSLTKERDLFMYSRVTRVKKQQQTNNSSTHTSSSGRTHGGGGGKF